LTWRTHIHANDGIAVFEPATMNRVHTDMDIGDVSEISQYVKKG
jgi:hypothetical protein